MRFHPTRFHKEYLGLFIILSFIVISCSKDSDLFSDTFVDKQNAAIEERTKTEEEAITEEETEVEEESVVEEETIVEEETVIEEELFESRTNEFFTLNDAHVQSGKGYNQSIVRLQESLRTSYLMFDLSPIDSISGVITSAQLNFTINGDNGSGLITISKGSAIDWDENNISDSNLPQITSKLGELTKEYKVGVTQEINLTTAELSNGVLTLIMNQESGNDLAFASKEHPSNIGSKLVVTYQVLEGADEIIIPIVEISPIEENTSVNQEPMSIADASPSTGGVPLEVTFTGGNSSDDSEISSYSWDFKDGTSSNTSNPTHTFTNVGNYQVELTVTDSEGLTNTDVVEITVNEERNTAPVAVATSNATSGIAPLSLIFNGSGSTDDNAVSSYLWDFKDGTTNSNANPNHTFNEAGSYTVELTVKDEHGLTDTKTIGITVNAPTQNNAPVAVASASTVVGEAPVTINFTGSNSTDDNGISSYYWNFPGDPSSASNATRTFNTPGIYNITLTVTDTEGLTNSTTLSITVNTNSGGGTNNPNVELDYFVTTNGSASNDGLTETTAWSLEHAFYSAQPGDIVYVKAGNYGNKELVMYNSGNSGSPIKFIGYTNSPDDLVSNQGSTFKYGESLNSNKMPLIQGSSSIQGIGLDLNGSNIEIHNFQISNFQSGLISKGTNVLLKNVIISNNGNQSSDSVQDGKGLQVYGNYTIVEDCFVLNSNSEGINFKGASNGKISYSSVYSNNITNPTGYYIFLSSGASNNIVENSTVYRDKNANIHKGHGLVLKDQATNNIIRNCKTYDTGIEVNFSGVYSNTFENIDIQGSYNSDQSEFSSNIRILNGAHDNTFKNIHVENALQVFGFADFDDGFVGSGGDRDKNEGGHNNKFISITSNNTQSVIIASSTTGSSAFSNNNEFTNCSFNNVSGVPFVSYQDMNNTKFIGCKFTNIPSQIMSADFNGGTFPISFQNCTFTNIGFDKP